MKLKCNNCGTTEKDPFDIGDECICGGVFLLDDEDFLNKLDRLEKHCDKQINHPVFSIAEEHKFILELIYAFKNLIPEPPKE
jgi:hypothetical protein